MDAELRASLDENRRHFDVVAERMTSRLERVAEGVTALPERLDRVPRTLTEDILSSQRELSAMIRCSYAELDRKIQTLEARHGVLEDRVRRLETGR